MTRTNDTTVKETFHKNGMVATRTVRYELNGKAYETVRFYSESGVYFNFFNRPAA